MNRIILSIVGLLAVFLFVGLSPHDAEASHSWGGYHWATKTTPTLTAPITLQLGNNMTGDWVGHLTTAASDWGSTPTYNGTAVANPLRTSVVVGAKLKRCGAVSGRVEVCNASYGQNGWLGLAQIWLSNGHIVQGTAKMNDSYFSAAPYNNPNEKLHVVCQEVGHTFGLDHQSTDGGSLNTCMDYFSNTGGNAGSTASTHPNQHDYDQLTLIYNHGDGYNSYSSAAAVAAGKPSGVPGKGGPDGVDGNGTPSGASPERGNWYVEDLGNGVQLVTHITWSERGR